MSRLSILTLVAFLVIAILNIADSSLGATIKIPEDYQTIQAGIDAASENDSIIVADGVYAGEGNRDIDFRGKNIVLRAENGPENCIIDCQGSGRGIYLHSGESKTSSIVGLTILNGAAPTTGGGNGYGGAIYCSNASPAIINCRVKNNSALMGSGIGCDNTTLSITNCVISQNEAVISGGGIACFSNCTIKITNCIVSKNLAQSAAGIASYYNSNLLIKNSTIVDNRATEDSGGLYADYNSGANIRNTIFWNNTPTEIFCPIIFIQHSNVRGGIEGPLNIDSDPLFVASENADYHLSPNSPCNYTGTAENAPDHDIEGNPRPQGYGYDMGAYETQGLENHLPAIDSVTISTASGDVPFEVVVLCKASDPDGQIEKYVIEYGDGSNPETNTTGIFTHTYTTIGANGLVCKVYDNNGGCSSTMPQTIRRYGTYHVPKDFDNIQAAIDASFDGIAILVSDGIYMGEGNTNLNFHGKAITLKSENGPEKTIIDCQRKAMGFIFENQETFQSIVSGFTINYGQKSYSMECGGIYCWGSSPTIDNCIIKNTNGCAIVCLAGSPIINQCIIKNNKSYEGTGMSIFGNDPIISGCVFSGNVAAHTGLTHGGGGINCVGGLPTIINSIFYKNVAYSEGGAIHTTGTPLKIINCTFYDNISYSGYGGSIYHYSSYIRNPEPLIQNCVFWDNIPNEIYARFSYIKVLYSDIKGGFAGEGNFSADPFFVDPAGGDFHLEKYSSCIDRGLAENTPEHDFDNTIRPQGSGIDVGAYEYIDLDPSAPVIEKFSSNTTEGYAPLGVTFTCVGQDSGGAIVSYTMNYGDGGEIETNNSGIFMHSYTSVGKFNSYCEIVDNDGNRAKSNTLVIRAYGEIHVPSDYTTIQEAIDNANSGDTVIVSDGTYTGTMNKNITFRGKAITVKSKNGPQNSIIDCERDGSGFFFSDFEYHDSILSGFTILNAKPRYEVGAGGGIYCLYSSPTIDNCIIRGTSGDSATAVGGISCRSYSSPVIQNCIITENHSETTGGGIYCYDSCEPLIYNCEITNNTALGQGGGISNDWYNFLVIDNCNISSNIASNGGGISSSFSYLFVRNSIVSSNHANYRGGGIWLETYDFPGMDEQGNNAIISNCTFYNNSSGDQGGGLYCALKSPSLSINSIFWGNKSDQIKFNRSGREYKDPTVIFCNVENGHQGEGNIDADPKFINPEKLDFHLQFDSSCIDSGRIYNDNLWDKDGIIRPFGREADIGAYEFSVTLADAISILQLLSGIEPTCALKQYFQNDNRIGLNEVVFVLQELSRYEQ